MPRRINGRKRRYRSRSRSRRPVKRRMLRRMRKRSRATYRLARTALRLARRSQPETRYTVFRIRNQEMHQWANNGAYSSWRSFAPAIADQLVRFNDYPGNINSKTFRISCFDMLPVISGTTCRLLSGLVKMRFNLNSQWFAHSGTTKYHPPVGIRAILFKDMEGCTQNVAPDVVLSPNPVETTGGAQSTNPQIQLTSERAWPHLKRIKVVSDRTYWLDENRRHLDINYFIKYSGGKLIEYPPTRTTATAPQYHGRYHILLVVDHSDFSYLTGQSLVMGSIFARTAYLDND